MRTHAGKEREHVTVRSKGLVDKMVESEVENESEPADEGEAARRYIERRPKKLDAVEACESSNKSP